MQCYPVLPEVEPGRGEEHRGGVLQDGEVSLGRLVVTVLTVISSGLIRSGFLFCRTSSSDSTILNSSSIRA